MLLVLGLLSYDSDRGKAMLVGGMLLGSLGGLDTALREHFSGFRSHTMMLAGVPAVGLAAILYFAGAPWPVVAAVPALAFAGAVSLLLRATGGEPTDPTQYAARRDRAEAHAAPRAAPPDARSAADLERTIAFYRDLLGLAIVHDGPSDDDPNTRHVWFGALDGGAGMLLSFMQYPELPKGVVGDRARRTTSR